MELFNLYFRLLAVLIFSALSAACSGDSAPDEAPAPAASTEPDAVLKASLLVSAGGPYVASAGQPVTLVGQINVTDQAETMARLQTIGRALQSYHQVNGTYPPSALLDANGRATVSWRVLLLPYLGQKALYDRFDIGKAWDDPVNRPLLNAMPDVYRASGASSTSTETGFAGVGGVGALFEKPARRIDGGLAAASVRDGVAMTAAVGPVGSSVRLPWTAPGDVDFAQAAQLGSARGFDGPGNTFTPLLFLDGTVRLMPDETDPSAMTSWATVVGGGCTPPSGLEVALRGAWDLNGDGVFEADGREAKITFSRQGRYSVAFRAYDNFGGTYNSTATVEVR